MSQTGSSNVVYWPRAEEMQKIVNAFSGGSKMFKVDIKKTVVMVDGYKLNSVLEFAYLGSTKSRN